MEVKNNLLYKRKFIENNRDNPIIGDSLSNKTTITKEIENFYDIGFHTNLRGNDYTRKFNPEKSKKTPKNLLDVLGPFSEQGELNSEFLDYESVREKIRKDNLGSLIFLPKMLAAFGGMGTVAYFVGNRSNYTAEGIIIGGILGGLGIAAVVKEVLKTHRKLETTRNIEFGRLKDSVHCIDNFIKKYKIYEGLK